MEATIRELIDGWGADDRARREEAALQAAMLLEKHSPSRGDAATYESLLRPELSTISLDETQREELVGELVKLLAPDKTTPSMLWALGKAASPLALERLLKWLRDERGREEEAVWQALVGVDNFLSLDDEEQSRLGVGLLVRRYVLPTVLERISAENPRAGELARAMLRKV